MKGKKEKVEVKEPEEKTIVPWRSSDIFQAFDEICRPHRRQWTRARPPIGNRESSS